MLIVRALSMQADTHCLMSFRFLLRYVSRDEITLLDRGTGGVPDVRSAIDSYEEISPLYGFLQYRRRKVVLSYLPEGLSRLIQGTLHPGSIDTLAPLCASSPPLMISLTRTCVCSPNHSAISVNLGQVLAP